MNTNTLPDAGYGYLPIFTKEQKARHSPIQRDDEVRCAFAGWSPTVNPVEQGFSKSLEYRRRIVPEAGYRILEKDEQVGEGDKVYAKETDGFIPSSGWIPWRGDYSKTAGELVRLHENRGAFARKIKETVIDVGAGYYRLAKGTALLAGDEWLDGTEWRATSSKGGIAEINTWRRKILQRPSDTLVYLGTENKKLLARVAELEALAVQVSGLAAANQMLSTWVNEARAERDGNQKEIDTLRCEGAKAFRKAGDLQAEVDKLKAEKAAQTYFSAVQAFPRPVGHITELVSSVRKWALNRERCNLETQTLDTVAEYLLEYRDLLNSVDKSKAEIAKLTAERDTLKQLQEECFRALFDALDSKGRGETRVNKSIHAAIKLIVAERDDLRKTNVGIYEAATVLLDGCTWEMGQLREALKTYSALDDILPHYQETMTLAERATFTVAKMRDAEKELKSIKDSLRLPLGSTFNACVGGPR